MIKAGIAKMNSSMAKDKTMMMLIKMAGVLNVAAYTITSIAADIQYCLMHNHQVHECQGYLKYAVLYQNM